MKKALVLGVMLGLLAFAAPPAQAATTEQPNKRFVFPVTGTIPCGIPVVAVGCAYNLPESALGYRPCENPFPQGSWVDVLTVPAPTPPAGKKMILEFTSFSEIDWDTWICAKLSNGSLNGGELAQGANILGQLCDNALGADNPVPIGCIETADAPAEAGKQYVLRAYNYSDLRDLPAIYTWIMV